jgi:hypothetical protein
MVAGAESASVREVRTMKKMEAEGRMLRLLQ